MKAYLNPRLDDIWGPARSGGRVSFFGCFDLKLAYSDQSPARSNA